MGYDFALNDQELARSFSLRDNKREDFFHSSGYADAQNSGKIGAASFGKTVAERQDLNENRRFVMGYENASLNSQIAITRERTRGMFEREQTNAGGMGGDGPGDVSGRQYGGGGAGQTLESNPRVASEAGGYRYHDDLARKQEMMRGGTGREGVSTGGNGNTTTNYRDYAAAAKQSFSQEQSRVSGNAGRYGGSYGGYSEGRGDSSRSGGYGIGRPQGGSGYGGSSIAKSFKPDFGMKFGSGGK